MKTARRVNLFSESVIREMTRLANMQHAVNLAQGFPDFDPPAELLEAAIGAMRDGYNQYAITWGSPRLRRAVAEHFAAYNKVEVDPDRHITVTCGATEGMMAALLAIIDPGDEVIIFEPFYENYGPDALLSGATPRYVRLHLDDPGFAFDPKELAAAFTPRTKAIIINTPHNPSGKVFTREELSQIAELCTAHDTLAVTDEVYEHILYDGAQHVSIASLPGMAERTITINSMSKTYSVTGWRVGWAIIKNEAITDGIRRAHDFLTVGAAAPLQEAGASALRFPDVYYREMAAQYREKRDLILQILAAAGFRAFVPRGAYYVMTDIRRFLPLNTPSGSQTTDVAFAHRLIAEIGVATVPGSSFYHEAALGASYIRFAFPKRRETLLEVRDRLARVPLVAGR